MPVDSLTGTNSGHANRNWWVYSESFVDDSLKIGKGLGAVSLDIFVVFEGAADFFRDGCIRVWGAAEVVGNGR